MSEVEKLRQELAEQIEVGRELQTYLWKIVDEFDELQHEMQMIKAGFWQPVSSHDCRRKL
jgi:hypothetical protein